MTGSLFNCPNGALLCSRTATSLAVYRQSRLHHRRREPFSHAKGGRQQWGDELIKLEFEEAPKHGCISADASRIALSIESDVHVINTESWNTEVVLRAHLSEVLSLAFQPDDPNILVTGSNQGPTRKEPNEPATILVWKLNASKRSPILDTETLDNVVRASSSATATLIADHGLELAKHAVQDLEALIRPSLRHIIVKNARKDRHRIHGRLAMSFQSNVFSPSGKWMVYLTRERPESNSVDTWDIKICTASDYKERFTLSDPLCGRAGATTSPFLAASHGTDRCASGTQTLDSRYTNLRRSVRTGQELSPPILDSLLRPMAQVGCEFTI